MRPIRTLRSYLQAMSPAFRYQFVSAIVLAAATSMLNWLGARLLHGQGRAALTTGDFMFLFTSWRGILLLVLAVVTAYLYVGMDINAKVAFAGRWVRGEDVKVREVIRDGFASLRSLCNPVGFLIVVYVAVMAPLAGVGLTISLTDGFRMPSFITSVIFSNPLYTALYAGILFVLMLVTMANTFSFHGIVLDDMTLMQSVRHSMAIMRKHWWNYLLRVALFYVILYGILAFVGVAASSAAILGLGLVADADETALEMFASTEGKRFVMVLFSMMLLVAVMFIRLVSSPFFTIKVTTLYEEYSKGERVEVPKRPFAFHPVGFLTMLSLPVLCVGVAFVGANYFDEMFPNNYNVKVIAHRACGSEGYENTAEGLSIAEKAGAWGAEIDIQRTSDGAYVVNHDDDFARVAGDSRKSYEMTLAEAKQLTVRANPADPNGPGVPVSSYEEMLDGARDHNLILFVELKGKTADRQMADDAVRIATERGVLDRCVFISLKYDLIKYLEEAHPNVKTGYLAFASYGDTEDIPCDYLALEEQVSQRVFVDAVHSMGKSVIVWTVNSSAEQMSFLASDVDAIITDNITRAGEEKEKIANWDDADRVLHALEAWI